VNAQLFVDLARLQRESGQLDEAVASLRLGARRSAEAGDTAGLESIRRAELDLVPATP